MRTYKLISAISYYYVRPTNKCVVAYFKKQFKLLNLCRTIYLYNFIIYGEQKNRGTETNMADNYAQKKNKN